MAGLFGLSGTEIIDYLIKLAPAASIVGGILAARVAKNHFQARALIVINRRQPTAFAGATVFAAA
jgi:hypothetical protein